MAVVTSDLRERAARARIRRVPAADPVATAAVECYYDELRTLFTEGFDPGPSSLDAGAFVIVQEETAEQVGPAIACGGVQTLSAATAEIKRMYVDPAWRGAGLGRRLLAHLESVAADLGHTRVVLDTSDRLTGAIAMYDRAGYARVPAYNDNPYARLWFAKTLS